MARDDRQQYYLRAEPTPEGRLVLRTHQEELGKVFGNLRLNPRLTKPGDLHWTTVFLGSPERWTRAFLAVGAEVEISANDLLALTIGNGDGQLPKIAHTNFGSSIVRPTAYAVFFNGGTNAVFTILLDRSAEAPARAVLARLRAQLHTWERRGKLPRGAGAKLFRHQTFPLARELNGGRPHVTLARGRVSLRRQRDVARTIRVTPLTSEAPIPFTRADIRMVGSSTAVP